MSSNDFIALRKSFLMILSTNSEISKKKKRQRERDWEERVIDQIRTRIQI